MPPIRRPPVVPPPPPHAGRGEAIRARLEQDGAYRELRRGELLGQRLATARADSAEARYAAELIDLATRLYHTSHIAYRDGEYHRAAEYAVAVKDLMRAVDKLHHATGGNE